MLEGAERELMGVAGAPYRLADRLSKVANQYAAVIIDTRPSFSFITEMGLLDASGDEDGHRRIPFLASCCSV